MSSTLPEVYRRYLRVLGIGGIPSGLEGLRTLVRRHLYRVPWENISKLLLFGREGRGRFFTLPEFLDGIQHQDLGGTCHSCNPFLAELLRALGYDVDLLAADMSVPDTHTCLRVRLGPAVYHVDVGYGGPFREPVPLDGLPCEVPQGEFRYVLDRRDGGVEVSVLREQERVHGYFAHEPPRSRDHFAASMERSFGPSARFVNSVRICRFFDGCDLELIDRKLSIRSGTNTTVKEFHSAAAWKTAIVEDLQMPRCPAEAALEVLERITGKPFFDSHSAPAGAS